MNAFPPRLQPSPLRTIESIGDLLDDFLANPRRLPEHDALLIQVFATALKRRVAQ